MIPLKLGKLEMALDRVQSGTKPGLFEDCPVLQSRGVTYHCTGQQKHWLQSEQFQVQDKRYVHGSVCETQLSISQPEDEHL